jgi:hypothetical protein
METRILHLAHRLIKASGLVALILVVAGSIPSAGQTPTTDQKGKQPLPHQITAWEDDVSGAIQLLHTAFLDIDSKSKMVIVNNRDWGHSAGGMMAFRVDVCEPDFPNRTAELQHDFLTRYDMQCSVLALSADFLMSGSQLGPVPAWVRIWRPEFDKRWRELATLLASHPEWSEAQVADALKASGVKYGAWNRSGVEMLIHNALPKLEPFFGKLTVDSIAYSPFDVENHENPRPPAWLIEVHPAGQDKRRPQTSYVLTFNIFDGIFESEAIYTEPGSAKPQ